LYYWYFCVQSFNRGETQDQPPLTPCEQRHQSF
jgi:hypothetical protein